METRFEELADQLKVPTKRKIEIYRAAERILLNEKFIELASFKHHGGTRQDHSIRVCFIAHGAASSWGMMEDRRKNVIIASLLHDLFPGSWRDPNASMAGNFIRLLKHASEHPIKASENALLYFPDLINIESYEILDAIKKHMFPFPFGSFPKYLESLAVIYGDKMDTAKYTNVKKLLKQ